MKRLKRILQCFQLISGLKINFGRSSLYSYSKDERKISFYASLLGCKVGSWPLTFLGDQIGSSSRKKVFWQPLRQKFKNKLASWKCRSLNQAGRLALIKSTINSLTVYWFSIHQVPKGVCSQLETIRRNFFWGTLTDIGNGESNIKKMPTLAWSKVCSSKKAGGFGLVSFYSMNKALLAKWIHKWTFERHKKWNV